MNAISVDNLLARLRTQVRDWEAEAKICDASAARASNDTSRAMWEASAYRQCAADLQRIETTASLIALQDSRRLAMASRQLGAFA